MVASSWYHPRRSSIIFMVAPVRVKDDYPPPDENDLATPEREITSRHRVDRRSLLPPRRVMPERGMPPAASAETCRPWPNRGRACQRAPPSEADEEDAAGPLKDRLIAELTEHRTKVITSIGGSIARKSALASASRIQKQKSHSLSLVTTFGVPCQDGQPALWHQARWSRRRARFA